MFSLHYVAVYHEHYLLSPYVDVETEWVYLAPGKYLLQAPKEMQKEILGSFSMPTFLSLVCVLLHTILLRMSVLLLVNTDSTVTVLV
jgi:hypothetical protein